MRAPRSRAQAWVILLPVMAAAPAIAATVEGTVSVHRPLATTPAPLTLYPRRGLEGPHGRPPTPDPGCNCVVYLTGAPDGPSSRPDTLTMRQRDERFVPHVLPIQVGDVVRFPNSDPFFHNVFSYSKPRRFDLGKYPRGQSRSVRFLHAGLVEVFCEIHAFMSAYILVLPNGYFASPDDAGRWSIRGVPPGSYRIVAWRPGDAPHEQAVTVGEGDRSVEVNVDF